MAETSLSTKAPEKNNSENFFGHRILILACLNWGKSENGCYEKAQLLMVSTTMLQVYHTQLYNGGRQNMNSERHIRSQCSRPAASPEVRSIRITVRKIRTCDPALVSANTSRPLPTILETYGVVPLASAHSCTCDRETPNQ